MNPIEIHWLDSTYSSGWVDMSGGLAQLEITTIGYLVNEDDESYTVTSSLMASGDCCFSPIRIPKVAVTGVWDIKLH